MEYDQVTLEEIIADDGTLSKLRAFGIEDPSKLANEYLKAQEHISSSARMPGEGASAEEWSKFYQRMGAPSTPDGYELPELKTDFRSLAESLRGVAAENGLTKKQFRSLVEAADKVQAERLEQLGSTVEQASQEWIQKGIKENGAEFEAAVAAAQRTVRDLAEGDEQLAQILQATGLGNHPKLIELLAKTYQKSGAHRMADGSEETQVQDQAQVARERAQRIREIMHHQDFTNRRAPEYAKLQEEYYNLQQLLLEAGYTGSRDPKLGLDGAIGAPYNPNK